MSNEATTADRIRESIVAELREYEAMHGQPWTYNFALYARNAVPYVKREAFLADMQHDGLIVPHPKDGGLWRAPAQGKE
jgi:hypothetical protein